MISAADFNDPYATAANAIASAREAAAALRWELPQLLGRTVIPTANMLADRYERGRVLDAFCRDAVTGLLAQCDLVIARGTREVMMLQETGWGPDGPLYSPEPTLIRTPEAADLLRIRQLLQVTRDCADRTADLIAGEEAVRAIRS